MQRAIYVHLCFIRKRHVQAHGAGRKENDVTYTAHPADATEYTKTLNDADLCLQLLPHHLSLLAQSRLRLKLQLPIAVVERSKARNCLRLLKH
jgi:hypothetical protein